MEETASTILGAIIVIAFFSGALPAWAYWISFIGFILLVVYGMYLDYKETRVDKVVRTNK